MNMQFKIFSQCKGVARQEQVNSKNGTVPEKSKWDIKKNEAAGGVKWCFPCQW